MRTRTGILKEDYFRVQSKAVVYIYSFVSHRCAVSLNVLIEILPALRAGPEPFRRRSTLPVVEASNLSLRGV